MQLPYVDGANPSVFTHEREMVELQEGKKKK
jgi:hypothetical protein